MHRSTPVRPAVGYPDPDGRRLAESDCRTEPFVPAATTLHTHFHLTVRDCLAGDMFAYCPGWAVRAR